MNKFQEHALNVLEKILQPSGKRNTRSTRLLCRLEPLEAYKAIPEAEFCQGWAYTVGPHFAEALDIELQQRKKNKQSYYIWTQGSAFAFHPGYTIHKADGSELLQIQDAKESSPGRESMQREPGTVWVQCYIPSTGPTIWQKSSLTQISQDDFVRHLITGNWGQYYRGGYGA